MRMQSTAAKRRTVVVLVAAVFAWFQLSAAVAEAADRGARLVHRLDGFDGYVRKLMSEWNCPGLAVGVVVDDHLVYAKGYGHRDASRSLPFTDTTLFSIGSNTKLFTAVAAGLLVSEGKLAWDQPIHESVPSIRFNNSDLTESVTLRDMLSHRTGLARGIGDAMVLEAGLGSEQVFDKLRYVEPATPLRQSYIYNNFVYAVVGRIIEMQSGKSWREFVRDRIMDPLQMSASGFSVTESDMQDRPDHAVPRYEQGTGGERQQNPLVEDISGLEPAGAIVSNIPELSNWLIALMDGGRFSGRQVIPEAVLKATLEPAVAIPNTAVEKYGWAETLNATYGMGRMTQVYRGHLMAYHGGDVRGLHSHLSYLPLERIGVMVFVIGDQAASLRNILGYNLYDRLLGLPQIPRAERMLALARKAREGSDAARAAARAARVADTNPSHPLSAYVGEYVSPAFGTLAIELLDGRLSLKFRRAQIPLVHYHYDRFDVADNDNTTLSDSSLMFLANRKGEIDKVSMSIGPAEPTFMRRSRGDAAASAAR